MLRELSEPNGNLEAVDADENVGDGATADGVVCLVPQAEQLKNPDARVTTALLSRSDTLAMHADMSEGLSRGDLEQFDRCFWEIQQIAGPWAPIVNSPAVGLPFDGREMVFLWADGKGTLAGTASARIQGQVCWGRDGVHAGRTGQIRVTQSIGEIHAQNCVAIVPKDPKNLAAITAFVSSPAYVTQIRKLNDKIIIPTGVVGQVPFDLQRWQKVAAEKYPNGLPKPQSDDPTQWLFHGHPVKAQLAAILNAAVARLVGYRWPAELDEKMRLAPEARAWVAKCKDLARFADDDGVVPLVPINKEQPGAERLRALLEAAFAEAGGLSATRLNDLLTAAGSPGLSLDEWAKHEFFAQHCALFHQRPFVWQIWDGRKDGFNILVHYHGLAAGGGEGRKLLEKIAYTYLGDWITQQQSAAKAGTPGADTRLKAAQDLQKKLEAIIAGEPPYDIFVRWKPLHQQPIGWDPDINDGVRMNIRPFVAAGVLRGKVNVKWTKDRGKEPESIRPKAQFPWFWSCPEDAPPVDFEGGEKFTGERLNDLHYTVKVKQAARDQAVVEPAPASGKKGGR